MLTPALIALLNAAADELRNSRPANAHRLLCAADRIAEKDRTIPTWRREAIRIARRNAVSAIAA